AVGNPLIGAAMVGLQMLDDAAGLDHRPAVVDQDREFSERPVSFELDEEGLRMLDVQRLVLELRPVGVERDQGLLRVGREGVAEEDEAHQSPALIFSRSSSSASLGSLVAKE